MVMEVTPTPQSVGQEFVRQFYTLLNQAPEFVHRFYSHDSTLIHSGMDRPVKGQKDIHQCIASLGYKKCHAKIRQVDAQAGVASSVVIQVTGELSTNGEPMRRFMQTFVLAPQTPKKYYVHNDIFRYQDEVFEDDDEDDDCQDYEDIGDEMMLPAVESQQPMSNGSPYEEDIPTTTHEVQEPVVHQAQELSRQLAKLVPEPEPPVLSKETVVEELTVTDEQLSEPSSGPRKPSSWAGVLAGGATPTALVPPNAARQTVPVKPVSTKKPEAAPTPNGDAPKPPRESRPRPAPVVDKPATGNGETETRATLRYTDAQQLFVGNLPHNVADKELKDFFESKYGKVVDVRINRKQNRDVPNFGFVIFAETDVVPKILKEKPILWKNDHRLNVEEKKPRGETMPRPGSGSRPPRGGGRGGGPGRAPNGRGGSNTFGRQ